MRRTGLPLLSALLSLQQICGVTHGQDFESEGARLAFDALANLTFLTGQSQPRMERVVSTRGEAARSVPADAVRMRLSSEGRGATVKLAERSAADIIGQAIGVIEDLNIIPYKCLANERTNEGSRNAPDCPLQGGAASDVDGEELAGGDDLAKSVVGVYRSDELQSSRVFKWEKNEQVPNGFETKASLIVDVRDLEAFRKQAGYTRLLEVDGLTLGSLTPILFQAKEKQHTRDVEAMAVQNAIESAKGLLQGLASLGTSVKLGHVVKLTKSSGPTPVFRPLMESRSLKFGSAAADVEPSALEEHFGNYMVSVSAAVDATFEIVYATSDNALPPRSAEDAGIANVAGNDIHFLQ